MKGLLERNKTSIGVLQGNIKSIIIRANHKEIFWHAINLQCGINITFRKCERTREEEGEGREN